jgi:transposase-like protein
MPRRVTRFTPEIDARIVAQYAAGVGHGQLSALAKELGIPLKALVHRYQSLRLEADAKRLEEAKRPQFETPADARQRAIFLERMPAWLLRSEAVENPV